MLTKGLLENRDVSALTVNMTTVQKNREHIPYIPGGFDMHAQSVQPHLFIQNHGSQTIVKQFRTFFKTRLK